MGNLLKLNRGVYGKYGALTLVLLAINSHVSRAVAKELVLLCKGTQHCATCADAQKHIKFEWTYTVDLSASTVDGFPAKISDSRIAWQIKSNTVLDDREISRYSKKFHFAGKALDGSGGEIYYGDGICAPQQQKAF
jgi:hypothetical protein